MSNLPVFSNTLSRALAFAVLVVGCSHPATPSTGGGGRSAGSGGAPGIGSGGNRAPGSGGAPVTGSGGGEVVIPGTGGGGGGIGTGGATVTKVACMDTAYSDRYTPGYTQDPAVLTQVQTILSSMSLADKAGQMRGTDPAAAGFTDIFRSLDNTARGVKGFNFRDGPRGVNLEAPTAAGTAGGRSTVFPVAMARGATFDLDLEFRIGQAMGDEMVAAGQTMLLAPTTNILRHPLWGRAQETYGEDPYQLGRLGSATVVGIQQYVPACAKHYAGNNIEQNRASLNAQMDEQTLREIYARHFEMMIRDGGVACIMAAYNAVNGVKSTQSPHLINDILRTDFGFKGFVLSDWWAMPGGSTATLPTASRNTNAAGAVMAGMDMELPWNLNFSVLEAITPATLPTARVDDAVRRILEQKIRFRVNTIGGAIGLKAKEATTNFAAGTVSSDPHIAIALEAALKSMVLLKNSNNTLPIRRASVTRIAVLGVNQQYTTTSDGTTASRIDFTTNAITLPNGSTNILTGDRGSSRVLADPAKSVGPLAGIMAAAGGGITVTGGNTAAAAANADFVVVIAGLTPQDEGEEYTGAGDRASFALDAKANAGAQNNLIAAAAALGKPMVVVLEGGSVIDMPWLAMVPAVVMAWYPGMVGGTALGRLLFGDANFSGKLPITWGSSLAQYPTFNAGTTTTMEYDIGYRRFDRMNLAPLYPFGGGLSYTTFAYSNLVVPCSTVTKNGVINVTVQVQNTGTVEGDEVAMLFVSYPASTKRRPIKELKGFYRVNLMPGVTKQITIPVRVSDLKYWDMTSSSWQVETGEVKISVGPNAATLPLFDSVTVQ